jgi:hypothetical protein
VLIEVAAKTQQSARALACGWVSPLGESVSSGSEQAEVLDGARNPPCS